MNFCKGDSSAIKNMFNAISAKYDPVNRLISLNCHKRWNRSLIKIVTKNHLPEKYLDLCSGTGDIALEMLRKAPPKIELFLLDFSDEMLKIAKDKLSGVRQRVHYLEADCRDIPLPGSSIDCITISYGIRNIDDPQIVIEESFRVLKKGGIFAILELTRPTNRFLRALHGFYLKRCVPLLGRLFAGNKKAYDYLRNSIEDFVAPETLKEYMSNAGLEKIRTIKLMGGIATIIVGTKP